jgi:hypothetical protein
MEYLLLLVMMLALFPEFTILLFVIVASAIWLASLIGWMLTGKSIWD